MKKNILNHLKLLPKFSVPLERKKTKKLDKWPEKISKIILLVNTGVFLQIVMLVEVSHAETNKPLPSQIVEQPKLQQVMLGTYQNREEGEKIAERLHQLGFETWINHLNKGYVVNAGAFSSKSNLERAVNQLKKAGLGDKIHVNNIPIKRKNFKTLTSTKSDKGMSITSDSKTSELKSESDLMDQYVPKKEYEKLEQEVETLKAQMQSLLNNQVQRAQALTTEELKTVQATAYPTPGEKSSSKNNLDVAEGNREEEAENSKRELDTFLRSQKVLYKRGELALDYNLSYGQDTAVNTFGFPPPTNRFNTTAKLTTRSVDTSLTIRYGLDDNLEFDLTVPYGYFEQNNDNQPFNINTQPVSHTNASGIGDISGAIRYTALTESGHIPDITLSLSTQAPTGNRHKGLGSGFWNVGAGVSLVKTIDPVVFFGSFGYNAALEDHGINPGNSVSYSIGAGYSMNDRVSFTTSLSGGITGRTEEHGLENPGSAGDAHSLQFSSTIQLDKRLFFEPFIGFGLTEDAQDFVVGFRMPYRFEQKFPLPFFSD